MNEDVECTIFPVPQQIGAGTTVQIQSFQLACKKVNSGIEGNCKPLDNFTFANVEIIPAENNGCKVVLAA